MPDGRSDPEFDGRTGTGAQSGLHPFVVEYEPVGIEQRAQWEPGGRRREVTEPEREVRSQFRDFRRQIVRQTTTVSREATWPAGRSRRSASGAKIRPIAAHRINCAPTE